MAIFGKKQKKQKSKNKTHDFIQRAELLAAGISDGVTDFHRHSLP